MEGAKEGDFERGFKVVAAELGTAVVVLEGDKEGVFETGFTVGDLENAAEEAGEGTLLGAFVGLTVKGLAVGMVDEGLMDGELEDLVEGAVEEGLVEGELEDLVEGMAEVGLVEGELDDLTEGALEK